MRFCVHEFRLVTTTAARCMAYWVCKVLLTDPVVGYKSSAKETGSHAIDLAI